MDKPTIEAIDAYFHLRERCHVPAETFDTYEATNLLIEFFGFDANSARTIANTWKVAVERSITLEIGDRA